jgi:2-methylcitrate dehydratase PrpD
MPDTGSRDLDGVTAGAARFVAGLDGSRLPSGVRQECLRAFVNAIGCIVGGSAHEMTAVAASVLTEHGGRPVATLAGRGRKTDVLTAAMINGLAGAAYSFDDTYGEAMLHPSVPVVAAMTAVAEYRPVSGAAYLTAYAGALEISCRLTKALSVMPAEAEMAWSQTGIVAGIGAALGCGRLLALDATQLQGAIGIAASEAAGTRAAHGSMAASLIYGRAAQSGLRAALLGEEGFTAPLHAIESRSGFGALYSRKANLPAVVQDLGSTFELMENTFKPYPCGVVIHPAIDAVLHLREKHDIRPDRIAQITLTMSAKAVALASRPDPATDIEAKVSLHHWVAVSALTGRAGVAEGRSALVHDPEVAALRRRIDVHASDAIASTAAEVSIRLTDGQNLHHGVEACSGSPARPMTDEQVTEKCRQQAAMVIGDERAGALTGLCWRLTELSDVSVIAAAAA